MLSSLDLAFLKESAGGLEILHTIFYDEDEFVFKALTLKEYENILLITKDKKDFEDAVCQVALLYPDDYDFNNSELGGVSEQICPYILEMSGVNDITTIVDMINVYKDVTRSSFIEQCMAIIKAAFNEYTYEEMENWPFEKIAKFANRAEYILEIRNPDARNRLQITIDEEKILEHIDNLNAPINIEEEAKKLDKRIDPMFYFKDYLSQKPTYVDYPLIGGIHWNDEEKLKLIRSQFKYE